MTLSSGEIDVVMARTTRGASWLGQPVNALAGCPVMTCLTVHNFLRISRVRKIINALIVPNNDVRCSSLNTREVRSRVNLVNHHLKVDGVARVGIRCLRRVASVAKQYLAPAAAMG